MATLVNYDIFWHRYLDHCELQRLEGIFDQLDFSETVEAIQAQRSTAQFQRPTGLADRSDAACAVCDECIVLFFK